MIVWIIFIAAILLFLALDLGVFNRNPHVISTKEASIWTAIWVSMSFLFSIVIYYLYNNGAIENVDKLSPLNASL